MNKIFAILLVISFFELQSQSKRSGYCSVDEYFQHEREDKKYDERLGKFMNYIRDAVDVDLEKSLNDDESCPNGIIVIPIAFHIFHEDWAIPGEGHNFSNEQLKLAVDYLNIHFSGRTSRKSEIPIFYNNFDATHT